MPAKSIEALPTWARAAAERMAREGLKLQMAAAGLDIKLSPLEADALAGSKAFQTLLRQAKNQFYREMVSDPTHGKDSTMGKLVTCADNLMATGEYDKAAEVLLKLAKVAGWVQPDQNVNVVANLTSKDIEAVKKELLERRNSSTIAGPSLPS